MTKAKSVLAAATLLLASSAALAQQSPMPEEIAWKLVELGPVIDPAKTAVLYAPLQQKEPYSGVKVERDVKYGPAELNRLDVFVPETTSPARPVLIFVHGGGFIGGNKRDPNAIPFYDNIMLWAAKNGFVGINIDYRLAPASTWPAVAEDLGLAVQWVAQNIAGRGGDPARVFLMGHSAGAAHVASYVSHPEFFKVRDGGLKGAIMVSGLYELSAETISKPQKIYFGSDPSHYAERSAMQGLAASKIPLMIATAELDPPMFGAEFKALKEATCKGANGCAHALVLPQHSHMSEVYSINTADERLTSQILDFVTSAK